MLDGGRSDGILTATGDVFCAGGDLKAMTDPTLRPPPKSAAEARTAGLATERFRATTLPVVAGYLDAVERNRVLILADAFTLPFFVAATIAWMRNFGVAKSISVSAPEPFSEEIWETTSVEVSS
mgnify:CR=1 FL=1